MSAHDGMPSGWLPYFDWEGMTEAEREEYLRDAFKEITDFDHERRHFHNRQGFYADLAYEAKCLALGHERSIDEESNEPEPEDDDELARDGTHIPSWGGDMLCGDTRYGTACTECEGECDFLIHIPDLWQLTGVTAALAEDGAS